MFTFEMFKKYCEAEYADEFYVLFRDKKDEYMIIIFKDEVSFQRCGGLELDNEGNWVAPKQSGETYYKSLDELYESDLIDGINLRRDWSKIEEIYPNGYGDFGEYSYFMDSEYIGELRNRYEISACMVPYDEKNLRAYDQVFNNEESDKDTKGIQFTIFDNDHPDKGEKQYLVYADYLHSAENMFFVDGNYLVVATYMEVLKISLETDEIVAYREIDEPMFRICKAPWQGYVVHRELGVSLLDADSLESKWDYDLGDVAVPSSGPDPFKVFGKHIEFADFANHYYCIDYEGGLYSTNNPRTNKDYK